MRRTHTLAFALLATTALTPAYGASFSAEIAQDMITQYQRYGLDLTIGAEQNTDTGVTWENAVITGAWGNDDEDLKLIVTIPRLELRDTGPEKAQMIVSDEINGALSLHEKSLAVATFDFSFTQDNPLYEITKQGSTIVSDYTMDGMSFTVTGRDLPDDMPFEVALDFTDVSGSEMAKDGDVPNLSGEFAAAAMRMTTHINDGIFNTKASSSGTGIQSSYGFDSPFPEGEITDAAMIEIANAFFTGARSFEFSYQVAAAQSSQTMMPADGGPSTETISYETQSGPSDMVLSLRNGEAAMTGSAEDISYTIVEFGALPMLAGSEFTLDAIDMDFGAPLSVAVSERMPAHLRMSLENLSVPESLWSIIDPMGKLDRAQINFAIDGEMAYRYAAELVELPDLPRFAPKATPESFTLNGMALSLAGAALEASGQGDLRGNMPIGEMNAKLEGGFALLATLSELGLVPSDQVMMIQGMAGMFANVDNTNDIATTKVEMKEGGSIFVNGMQVQ